MNKIVTLGDIFENLQTEEKALKFLGYMIYLQSLPKENKKLGKEIKKIKKEDNEIRVKNSFLVNGFHDLEERIDKAIEYIKTHKNDYAPYELSDYNIRELLNKLQGSDKE